MKNIEQLFSENGFVPAPDVELTALLTHMLEHMTEKDLATYIEKVKKYDKQAVHVMQTLPGQFLADFGNTQPVHWWHLRKDLEILPKYFEAAEKSGFTKKERVSLLFALADSHKYDFGGITRFCGHSFRP